MVLILAHMDHKGAATANLRETNTHHPQLKTHDDASAYEIKRIVVLAKITHTFMRRLIETQKMVGFHCIM